MMGLVLLLPRPETGWNTLVSLLHTGECPTATDQAPSQFLVVGVYLNTQYVTEWCFRGPYSKSYFHPDEIIFALINPIIVLNLAEFAQPQ